jgi:S-adenosylmethionine:tRNA ribosyltransferase-isomerase
VQSQFSARPWSVELASAGRPLTSSLLAELERNGIRVAFLTHAAGLSSTGSVALDVRLPFPERYAIPERTASTIREARAGGKRVVAVGTTVVRALEASAAEHGGAIEPGEGLATLRIGPGFRPRVADGVLTGMHERGTSHFALMEAFAPSALLERALEHAASRGYLQHEFGDSCLVLGG